MAVRRLSPTRDFSPENIVDASTEPTESPVKILNNYIYLYHTDEWLFLPEYPDQIADNMQSTFSATNALSRTAPVFSYSNSGPRKVQVQLNLHRDMLYQLNYDVSNFKVEIGEDYVSTLIKKIQAITLPVYDASKKGVIPPMIAIRFGREVFIKGVVQGGLAVVYQKPIMDEDKYANVTLNFEVYEVDPYDAISAGQEGSYRGVTKIFEQGLLKQ